MSFKKFKTEKMLLVSIGVLTLFLFASAFSKDFGTNVSMAGDSGSSGSSELSSEDSGDSEDSTSEDSGNSEDSTSEDSTSEEGSELSVSSAPSVKRMQTAGSTEVSEESSSEDSQQSTEEASEASEPSEESIKYVEGYGDVVSKEGNIALVKKNGKLFFLIPVEIESQLTLDEQGTVVSEEKSFLNWLLSVFSF